MGKRIRWREEWGKREVGVSDGFQVSGMEGRMRESRRTGLRPKCFRGIRGEGLRERRWDSSGCTGFRHGRERQRQVERQKWAGTERDTERGERQRQR